MAAKVERYRSEGYTKFQLKVGGDPDLDIERIRTVVSQKLAGEVVVADANTGWTQHDAIRIVTQSVILTCTSSNRVLAIESVWPFGNTRIDLSFSMR